MRKRNLNKAMVLLAAACCMSFPAYAGTVELDSNGEYYQNDDGTRVKDGWIETWPGKWTYYGADGYKLRNTITPDGYTVNDFGIWQDPNGIDLVTLAQPFDYHKYPVEITGYSIDQQIASLKKLYLSQPVFAPYIVEQCGTPYEDSLMYGGSTYSTAISIFYGKDTMDGCYMEGKIAPYWNKDWPTFYSTDCQAFWKDCPAVYYSALKIIFGEKEGEKILQKMNSLGLKDCMSKMTGETDYGRKYEIEQTWIDGAAVFTIY